MIIKSCINFLEKSIDAVKRTKKSIMFCHSETQLVSFSKIGNVVLVLTVLKLYALQTSFKGENRIRQSSLILHLLHFYRYT